MTTVETPILNTELLLFSGMRFGLMQTKVELVSLLSKYQLSVSKKTPIPLVFDPKSFALSPLGGMWLQIKKRVE
jgi:cytochrome P450 family 6